MLFIVISGYCVTASAVAWSHAGMGFAQYVYRRLHRLYPPYLASLGYFALTRLAKDLHAGSESLRDIPLLQWIQNITMTQWFTLVTHPTRLAAGNPANLINAHWSLGYEDQFYLIVGGLMTLACKGAGRVGFVAGAITVCSIAWLVAMGTRSYGLFCDYWLIFLFGGLVYYRILAARREQLWIDLSLAGVLLFSAIAAPWDGVRPRIREVGMGAGFALLFIYLRPLDEQYDRTRIGCWLARLGWISYSLYLIHQCNVNIADAVAARCLPARVSLAGNYTIQLLVHILIAAVFWKIFERPFMNLPSKPTVKPA